MTIKLKLEPDYHSWPLWGLDDQLFDDSELPQYGWIDEIDPGELPLEKETIDRLNAWAEAYDSVFLDRDGNEDFSEPGCWSDEQWHSFWKEGFDLWIQLRQELGAEYEVFYNMQITSERQRCLLKNPDELKAIQVG